MGIHKENKTSEFHFRSAEHTRISCNNFRFLCADNERISGANAFIFGVVVVVVVVCGGVGSDGDVMLLLHSILLSHRLLIPRKAEWGVRGE